MRLKSQIVAPLLVLGLFALGVVVLLSAMTGHDAAAAAERPDRMPWVLGGLAIAGCLAVALSVMLRTADRVSSTLKHLPRAIRHTVRTGEALDLPGKPRRDELGFAVRLLETHAQAMFRALHKQAEIEKLALTDALTGLPNRRGLTDFLSSLRGTGPTSDTPEMIGIVHLDLDHFKAVNDTLGHEAGDLVLMEAARRMVAMIRDGDILARIGGDEFVIVVPEIEGAEALQGLTNRIITGLSEPIPVGEETCQIGASAGLSLTRAIQSNRDADSLLRDADAALTQAKTQGRNRSVVFTQVLAEALREKQQKAREIREALLHGEFMPWFQPSMNVETGEVTGIELLTRWQHPKRGLLPPREFLDAAEAHNLIEEIGLDVLERGCKVICGLRASGLDVPAFHLNMTRAQLLAPAMFDKISWILDDANIPLEQAAIEISERICAGRNSELIFANAKRLGSLGLLIVLDDFGADGGAVANISLTCARQVKSSMRLTDMLSNVATQNGAEDMLCGMLGVSQALDVTAVAKGVERAEQAIRLRKLGFSIMQGDALAPAMDGHALRTWLDERQPKQHHLRSVPGGLG